MTIKRVEVLGAGVCGLRDLLNGVSKIVAVLLCALLLCVSVIRAQQNTADILGTVTDTSGAVVPGATVTLTNTGTNVTQTAQSNEAGDYTFTLVQVGNYSIKVLATGFKTYVAPSVSVSSGDRARIDAKMEVGTQTQTVEVQATSTPALQTETSNLSTLVTTQAVEDLPFEWPQHRQARSNFLPGHFGRYNRIDLAVRARVRTIGGRRWSFIHRERARATIINNNTIDGMDNNERIIGSNIASAHRWMRFRKLTSRPTCTTLPWATRAGPSWTSSPNQARMIIMGPYTSSSETKC